MLVLKACSSLIKKNINNFKIVAVFDDSISSNLYKQKSNEFKKIVKELGLKDHIIFISSINPELMPSYYAGIDILCVPSYNETFGMVYLETMAAGKIAIAGNSGGPQNYIKHNKSGFLVDMENINELADVLGKLLTNKIDLKRIQIEAQKTASNFSYNKMGENIEKIYLKLLKKQNHK